VLPLPRVPVLPRARELVLQLQRWEAGPRESGRERHS